MVAVVSLVGLAGWVPVVAAEELPVDSLDPAVESAPTLGAALSEAAQIEEPVLAESLLTETSAVFANPDGSRTLEVFASPVRVEDPSAPLGWSTIDLDLAVAGGRVDLDPLFLTPR